MIRLHDVVKEYRPVWPRPDGSVQALDGVSLSVQPGETVAIVGLNGAGKSTLLRVLLGYVRPTSGEATIAGLAPRRYVQRHGIAYVPEHVAIPRGWTVEHALRSYAMLADLGDEAWARVAAVMNRLGLGALADRTAARLSKGNLQRLAIAQAILGDRQIMVLDEPTDALDPIWIVALRDIVAEWRAADSNRIVIVASHNLPEVERLAHRILLLHRGRLEGELTPGTGGLETAFLERVLALEESTS